MTPDKKICKQCLKSKTLDSFHLDKLGKQGRKAKCKDCNRIYREQSWARIAEYRAGRRVEAAEYARSYRRNNPEVDRRHSRKRRALKRNLPHQPLTPQQYEILHRQKYEIFGGNVSGN